MIKYKRCTTSLFHVFMAIILAVASVLAGLWYTNWRHIDTESLRIKPGFMADWMGNANIQSGGYMFDLDQSFYILTYPGMGYSYIQQSYNKNSKEIEYIRHSISAEIPGVYIGCYAYDSGKSNPINISRGYNTYVLALQGNTVHLSDDCLRLHKFEYDWKSVFYNDGKYDYDAIYQLLLRQETEYLRIEEAAALLGLIQEGVLIGYSNQKAVFAKNVGDGTTIIRMTPEETQEFDVLHGESEIPLMAVENYLFYVYEGTLYNYRFDAGKTSDFSFLEEPVRFVNFRYEEEYDQVSIAFVTDSAIRICIVTGNTLTNGTTNKIDSPVLGCYMSDRLIYLCEEDGGYHWYNVPIEKGDEIAESDNVENGGENTKNEE